ncbi:MAG: hypothetical protein ABI847_13020 [Anaerolineales bacterium]
MRLKRAGVLLLSLGLACGLPRPAPTGAAPETASVRATAPVPTTAPAATRLPATQTVPTASAAPQAGPELAGCPMLPADDIWNARVDNLPIDFHSDDYVAAIGVDEPVHADFGSGLWEGGPIGIPYVVVPGSQPGVDVSFYWDDQSDPGQYPIPNDAPIEGGPDSDGDRHVLVLDQGDCDLYELYKSYPESGGSWSAMAGAIYDLNSYALRPETWTSADAAGLPILPGLARYDEVAAGAINHALRFTAPDTQQAFTWPARHQASDLTGLEYPPMGQRFRLKADFDLSGYSPAAQVILQALKTYGMMLADNGSPWFISGAPDERWDNDVLHELDAVVGSDFEAVDVSSLMLAPDSGQVRPPVAYDHFLFLPIAGRAN